MKLTIAKGLRTACFPLALAGGAGLAFAGPANAQPQKPAVPSSRSAQTLPSALRPVLYRALAKDAGAAYRLDAQGCATLPGQTLKACFDRDGAHFTGAGSPLALRLAAYGRMPAGQGSVGRLVPVSAVQPAIRGDRVSYRHGNLSEWWQVLPVGFEQGFTLAKRPAGHGELTFALATNRQNAGAPVKGTVTWGKLRYGGLVVTDANGKVLPSVLKSEGDRVLIAVNDARAAYPLTVDPLVWLEQKVIASDGEAYNAFGNSVAVEGTTALIGAPDVNDWEGAVYAFTYADGAWTQTQKFFANDGVSGDGATFGATLSLDGTTALIGALGATINGNGAQGAAYVFTESNGSWSQEAKLVASDGAANNYFSQGLAIDGDTALIASYGATVHGNSLQGEAYIFTNSGGTWSQTQELTANDGAAGAFFGRSAALSGTTALVGAPYATIDGNSVGAAYIFTDSGGTWTQAQKLTASNGTGGAGFGFSVALSGSTALVGANGANVGSNSFQGAAYVFTESGGSWSQTAELTSSDGAGGDDFGYAVALSGATALVGADRRTVNGNLNQGTAYRFASAGGTWTQTAEFVASGGATGDFYGSAVAVAETTALVGAAFVIVHGNAVQGAAYFYGGSDLGLAVSAPQTVGQGQQYVSQTIATNNSSAASPAVSATMTVPAAASFVSAMATQGSCSEASSIVTCDFGAIDGNAGTATANVTLKATGSVGDTIDNVSGIARATPPLTASAATTITAGGACPDGYSEYDGTLNPGEVARSPVYQAPGGSENAILTAPERFQLYAVYQSGRYGRHVYLVPGNEAHRWGPKGLYMWLVRARDGAGAYTLCLLHP